MNFDLITVLGPTASGKTKLAAIISQKFNCEIISADSRQVYKRMDIGTGKDLEEFKSRKIKFNLIDIVEPDEEYNMFRFQKDFYTAFNKIKSEGKFPLVVGGTGLYLSSILQNYELPESSFTEEEFKRLNSLSIDELKKILLSLKPKLHNTTDVNDKERIIRAIFVESAHRQDKKMLKKLSSLTIGTELNRDLIKKKITERLKHRLNAGIIDEVNRLLDSGLSFRKLELFGLEYRYVSRYIKGELNYNDMFQKLNSAIHNFAKRQMTWFRKMEKEGVEIFWFNPDEPNKILYFIENKMKLHEHIA
jgi:tRNA dimethylallyltransferase